MQCAEPRSLPQGTDNLQACKFKRVPKKPNSGHIICRILHDKGRPFEISLNPQEANRGRLTNIKLKTVPEEWDGIRGKILMWAKRAKGAVKTRNMVRRSAEGDVGKGKVGVGKLEIGEKLKRAAADLSHQQEKASQQLSSGGIERRQMGTEESTNGRDGQQCEVCSSHANHHLWIHISYQAS